MAGEKNMQTEKLKEAVELMKQGEEKGFNYIYGETYNFVYSRAKLAINDEQEVQDLVQEVYVSAYRNIASLKNTESLYAWLNTITIRQGASMIRKKKKQVLLSEENQGMFEEIPDESVKLENDAITRENAEVLKELLEKLPAEQKSAIVSFYYDGLKVEQIAELTKNSVSTIKSRLYQARKRLQEYILELEKKQGCRLHGFSAPLLLLAINLLLEETTLSKAAAQGVYQNVCAQVGMQASTLAFQSAGAGNTAMANPKGAAGLAGKMKGQGTGMKKLLSKLAGLGKVKIAAIVTGTVAVAGAGTAVGVYAHHQAEVKETQIEAEKKEEAEKKAQKEQEKLLADLTERYEKAEELRDNLILEDAVIEILNRDFTTVKDALDNKKADDETEKTLATLEKNLDGYKQQNEQFLTSQRAAMMDYHTEMFPQETQDAWDKLLAEYQELFDSVKYKDAYAKLAEVNTGIMAYLQENTTEVAENETEENTGNGTADNGNNGNGNTGSGSGNGNGSTGNGNTGSGSGNGDSGSGNTGNAPSQEQPTAAEEPTQTGDFPNGWTYAEADIMSSIYVDWFNFVYTDEEAQAQLAARLPGRSCTLVHYPPEQAEQAKELWNSLDRNVYCVTGRADDPIYGSYFIYGK